MTKQERSDLIYFYVKSIEACVFLPDGLDIGEFLCASNHLEAYIVFQTLEIIIDENKHNMDETAKENARRVLYYFKDKYVEIPAYEVTEKLNKILVAINKCDDSNINAFIEKQMFKRCNDKKFAKQMALNKVYSLDVAKTCIAKDFDILVTHSNMYNEEEFDKISNMFVENNSDYMGCINAIVSEYPDIMKNVLFKSRVEIVSTKIQSKNVNCKMKRIYKNIYNKFKTNANN